MSTNIKRFDYLDALRGVAVFLVLLAHCKEIDKSLELPPTLFNFADTARYGVQLFFVISAFTIFYSLINRDSNVRNFVIRRVFRIAPLYLLAVLIYPFLFSSPLKGIALNAVFLHGLSPEYINRIVPGGWSVGIEVLFYAMAPLLFLKIRNTGNAIYFFNLTIIVRFLINYEVKKLGLLADSAGQSFYYFWLPNQLPIFAIGIAVYFILFEPFDFKRIQKPLMMFASLALFSAMTMLSFFGEHIIFGLIWALLIIILSKSGSAFFINRFTLFMGKISYSVYLSQFAVILILHKVGYKSIIPSHSSIADIVNFGLNYLILTVVSVAVSYVLFKTIEEPFQSAGRKLISRLKLKNIPQTTQEKAI